MEVKKEGRREKKKAHRALRKQNLGWPGSEKLFFLENVQIALSAIFTNCLF
jgi:hypothetical protein